MKISFETLLSIVIVTACIGAVIFSTLIYDDGKNIGKMQSDYKKAEIHYKDISEGKQVGRQSILLYLRETNQIDSIKIDLHRLFTIEDSISVLQHSRIQNFKNQE